MDKPSPEALYSTINHKILSKMSNMRNKVQLIGRLGAKAEIKEFESGKKKATFSLATNDFYRNKAGEKVEETTWPR